MPGEARMLEPAPTTESLEKMLAVDAARPAAPDPVPDSLGPSSGLITGILVGAAFWIGVLAVFLSLR